MMEVTEDQMEKLHAVFDLCDSEQKGYISVSHFIDLAKEHFGAGSGSERQEDIERIVQVLDPDGAGRIHFSEFCQGVKQILELKTPSSPLGQPDYQLQLQNLGARDTLIPQDEDTNSCGTHETSELSTFNEYDMMTDDDQAVGSQADYAPPSSSSPSLPRPMVYSEDDQDSGKSSEGQDQRADHEVTDEEEKFEDYGGGEDGESEPDIQSAIARHMNRSLQVPHGVSAESHKKLRHRDKRDWLRPRRSLGNNRRGISSSGLASQLFRSGSSATSRRSSCSDDIYDEIDGNFGELNEKVKTLETQILMLTDSQQKNDQRHVRMKEENSSLVERRVHILEEQLRDVEVKSHDRLAEEQKQHREMLSRTDKEKTVEIDLLRQSLQHIEKEYQSLKEEAPRLRNDNDRLRRESAHLENKLTECNQQLNNLADENQELHVRFQEEKQNMEQERRVHAQLIDELSKELEELRCYKLEVESGRVRSRSSSVELPRSQRRELEANLVRLKEENAHLREQHEEMQAHLLSSQVQQGRSLLENGGAASLAEEIENLPKDELLRSMKELQEENHKLRDYVDLMTLKILEENPALLEVPPKKNGTKKKK